MTIPTTAPPINLSPDQTAAVEVIKAWYEDQSREELRIGGLAGTGKTTISAMLPELLAPATLQFAAPTGRAASILTRKLGVEARTLHSILYLPESTTDHVDECVCGDGHTSFNGACAAEDEDHTPILCMAPRIGCICPTRVNWVKRSEMEDPPPMAQILVIDESSMVGDILYRDVMELPCRKIWVGDHGQLPPVMSKQGVLTPDNLDATLTQIHRQADNPAGNNIVDLAHSIRTAGMGAVRALRDAPRPGITIKQTSILKANIKPSPDRLVVCWKNATRVHKNAQMRAALGLPTDVPTVGERVICLRNNREKKIFNGMMGVITEIHEDKKFTLDVSILMENDLVFRGEIVKAQFGQEKTLNDSYGNLFDYGYCITVHKSQGSQAREVVVLCEGYQDMGANDPKWLYTASTRSTDHVIFVIGGK